MSLESEYVRDGVQHRELHLGPASDLDDAYAVMHSEGWVGIASKRITVKGKPVVVLTFKRKPKRIKPE